MSQGSDPQTSSIPWYSQAKSPMTVFGEDYCRGKSTRIRDLRAQRSQSNDRGFSACTASLGHAYGVRCCTCRI